MLKRISNVTFCLDILVNSSKESDHSSCIARNLSDQNQVKVVRDCERRRNDQFNKLQERFNALTAEKNRLENNISELTNKLRKAEQERDRLKMKDKCEAKPIRH